MKITERAFKMKYIIELYDEIIYKIVLKSIYSKELAKIGYIIGGCSIPLSSIFQFYWWRKQECPEKTMDLSLAIYYEI
jgi:hypothetical protein